MNDNALVKLDAARTALAECKTVMEVKEIADMAEAARVYLERTNASVETVNRATEIRLLAERQMGEFLNKTPRAKGGAHYHTPASPQAPQTLVGGERVPSIPEIGITYPAADRARKLADIPKEEFEARVAIAKIDGKLTTSAILKKTRRVNTQFNFGIWQRQTRSVMTSWLESVPESARGSAVSFLVTLPQQILEEIQK